MSIPKEPRQIMINLMYLVLTALLALNVSAEVMNAFFSIDKSLAKSGSVMDVANEKSIASMEAEIKNRPDDKPLLEKANEARGLVTDFMTYIDGVRDDLTEKAGGMVLEHRDKTKIGKPKNFKNKEITTAMFVDGSPAVGDVAAQEAIGNEVKTKIQDTKQKLIDLVNEVSKVKPQISKEKISALKDQLTLSVDDSTWQAVGKPSWEAHTFKSMPVAAVFPILRKFQSDAKSAESTIINFLANEIGATVIEFDKFSPVAASEKSYVIEGETYKADVFLSAASSQVKDISVTVNGSRLPIKDGVAKYTANAASSGEKSYNVSISVKNPFNGKVETYKKTFKYEVGRRSVAVSADKMNVFYIGVDNPVTVSAAGVSSNELNVSASGGGIDLQKKGKSQYNAIVRAPGEATITVSGGGLKASPFKFRVKRIPDPTALLGKKNGGAMGTGEMKAHPGLRAVLQNFDFDAKCNIAGFELTRVPKRQDPVTAKNSGRSYNAGKVKNMVQAAKPGDIYYFDNVRAKCPGDGATRKINPLVFKIR